MGRKSHSKQNAKKSSSSKENSKKLPAFKRKELSSLVDKLLKLTSLFQATITLAKSWEHHIEIEKTLKEIYEIESNFRESLVSKSNRTSCLANFLKWLSENGAQFDGIEIKEFEGYELGLKAMKDFSSGSLVLTVPRKLMMTEDDAKKSMLSEFIAMDPLLQNMPNITLALFLLLEKSNPDSFWKPYLDVLPEKYTTVLYFTSEEINELRPSPVLEQSLKLCRSIARQYAYFHNKFLTSDDPAAKQLRDVFTYESYRWAVSTVMTRQNSVPRSSLDTTAFIPLWDMCNHEEGKITTDFNPELERGECFALRDFKAGEQIFIYYGLRSNAELFLHNGFVYPNNKHDRLTIPLGISSSDPLKAVRMELLGRLGLGSATHYSLHSGAPLSPELLAFIRIFNMNKEELEKWSTSGVPGDLVSAEADSAALVGPELDKKAYSYLMTRCNLIKMSYQAKDGQEEGDNTHRKNIKLLKDCEVKILDDTIVFLKETLSHLPAEPTNEQKQ